MEWSSYVCIIFTNEKKIIIEKNIYTYQSKRGNLVKKKPSGRIGPPISQGKRKETFLDKYVTYCTLYRLIIIL